MSEEAIINNKISIIRAAQEMIREDGIQSVSARSLGTRVGMNSALIYRYFKDIDEVILFACVHVLQEYTREMAEAMRAYETTVSEVSDREIYMLSWRLFSKHAFSNPEEYNILFFSKHSAHLDDVITEYYKLLPHGRTADEDDIMLEGMYRSSNLRKRNLILLIPVLKGKKTEHEIDIINYLTISMFFALLTQLNWPDNRVVTAESQTARMLEACEYLINL